ncbi:RhoGAP-domain-containing protein [Conidiobolus coronatus NRRL 28638]|uniref:RhoGAP-domain-containing protein n=1 Tax=Conidiobolus coronatus (strain ATCC 28846 / CBS 209.66 / NRRL 28638) TaxID=796925 RepID=A0A137P181_CONC2|nr:RhoGAP-domain-containing protein [Conidiobolus coronatus NRRL 28638]|eukprot:KXN68631.1 RhoGAP-domain-containing protein [Conidiobolus coronatus NRRL 28638]
MKTSASEANQVNSESPEVSNNEYETPTSPLQLDDSTFLSNEDRLQAENDMLRAQVSKLWGIINKQRAVINTLQSKVPRRGSTAGLIASRLSEEDPLSNDSEASTTNSLLRPQLSPPSHKLYLQAKKQYKRHTSIDNTLKSSISLNPIEENKQLNPLDITNKSELSKPINEETSTEPVGLGLVNSSEEIASNLTKSRDLQTLDKPIVKSLENNIAQSSKLLGRTNRARNHSIKEESRKLELNTNLTSKSQPSSSTLEAANLGESPPPSPTKFNTNTNVNSSYISSPLSRSPINSTITLDSEKSGGEDMTKDSSFNTKLEQESSFNSISTKAGNNNLPSATDSQLPSLLSNNNETSKLSASEQHEPPPTSTNSEEQAITHPLTKLDGIGVEVYGSAVRTNSKGKETLVFKLQLKQLPPSIRQSSLIETESIEIPGKDLWIIEKHFSDFLNLDNKIKQLKTITLDKYSKLPEKKHWSSISPSKLDQRKFLLQQYLMRVIVQSLGNDSCMEVILEFLNSDLIQNDRNTSLIDGKMEGYLIKRGKNFGKWKRRYFILNSSVLNYYDTKNGQWLGSINLPQVQVVSQQTSNLDRSSEDNGIDTFRHAFMILEPKKNSTFSRHVLCADSDIERDHWVEALSVHMNPDLDGVNTSEKSPKSSILKSISTPDINSTSPKRLSPTTPESTLIESEVLESESLTNSPSSNIEPNENTSHHSIQQHTSKQSVTISPNESQITLPYQPPIQTDKSQKLKPKNSKDQLSSKFLGLNNKEKEKAISPNTPSHITLEPNKKSVKKNFFWNKRLFGNEVKKSSTPLPIFGVNLQQSVATSSIGGYPLPSVVYRCIQYLDAKNAQEEEGIYRLSGSTTTIDSLRGKFEIEGDFDILKSNVNYDIHAVAGLLKMFLRNLPSTVLTSELQPDFLQVTDLLSRKDRVRELGKLVCSLPIENYTLLRALVSHLLGVVEKSNINKMNLKNIGIIFAPSLGIPAGVFTLFMSEFNYIFYVNSSGSAAPRELTDNEDDDYDGGESLSTTNTNSGKVYKIPTGKSNTDSSQFEEEFTQDSIGSSALNSTMVNLKSRSHRRVKSEDLIKVSSQEIFQIEANGNSNALNQAEKNNSNATGASEKPLLNQIFESPTPAPGKSLSVTSSRQSSSKNGGQRLLSKSSSHMNIKLSSSSSQGSQKRNRSNRNSILYQFTAPPEVVERERRLSVSVIMPSDEYLEEYALNVSTVSETSLPNADSANTSNIVPAAITTVASPE